MLLSIKNVRYASLALVSIILLASCNKDNDMVVDLLSNGNVELGVTSPDDWFSLSENDKHDVAWTEEESHSPDKSLSISIETADSTNMALWTQTFNSNIPHGESVTLQLQIKANLIGEGVCIAIRGDDTDFALGNGEQFVSTQGTNSITGNFDWTEFSVTLNRVDSDIKSLSVFLVYLKETSGTVYFDDIRLNSN